MKLQVLLFIMAVPLNLIWEVAQVSAYDFPESNLMKDLIGCFLPSLGDGLMTLMIYWTGWLAFREAKWILKPGFKGYLLMLGTGVILALVVEWNALYRTGAWTYSELMLLVPIVGVGLLPILQMMILPPTVALLVQRIWKNRKQTV